MKDINLYITEKLHLNKDIKLVTYDLIEKAKDVDVNVNQKIFSFAWPDRKDIQKMMDYKAKGSKPERLVNSIKDNDKLKRRFVVATRLQWEEAINTFGHAIIDRGIFDENDVILYIAKTYLKNVK